MCWETKNTPRMVIADKDIPVFKIGYVWDDGRVSPYFFHSYKNTYVKGKVYEETHIQPLYRNEIVKTEGVTKQECTFIINQGLHSYNASNIRLKASVLYNTAAEFIPCVETMTYKTTPNSVEVLVRGQIYQINYAAIILCIIPQGTRYYVNGVGEMVSEKIEVKEIIKTPFTSNENNTTSVRSVDKINKILNYWEEGKLHGLK